MQMCLCGRGRLARATAGCYSDLRVQRKYEYRRCLPHYQKDNRILFITYSTWHRWKLPEIARDLALGSCLRANGRRSEEHTSELQSHSDLVCRLLLEKKKKKNKISTQNSIVKSLCIK